MAGEIYIPSFIPVREIPGSAMINLPDRALGSHFSNLAIYAKNKKTV